MVYLPKHFTESDPAILAALMRRHPFATLVSSGGAGLIASHIPLLYDSEPGPFGRLHGHLALPNPQTADLRERREALAIFHGPHAYISPRWYKTHPAVPTWNYAVVHAYGTLEPVPDKAGHLAMLDRLATLFEAGADHPWRLADQPESYVNGMVRGVLAFTIAVTRLEGKFKLNQNRSAEDRRGVIAALREEGDADAAAVAALMAERTE
jgi:transcriptional regulator